MLSLGLLWGKNQVSFLESVFAIQLGLIPANVFMVLIGKKFGLRVLSIPPFSWIVNKDVLGKALSHLYRHSRLTIIVSRFTPTIRGPVYLAVGISQTPIFRFIKFDFLASLVQIPILLILGRILGQIFSVDAIYKVILCTTILFFGITVVFVIFNAVRKKYLVRSEF